MLGGPDSDRSGEQVMRKDIPPDPPTTADVFPTDSIPVDPSAPLTGSIPGDAATTSQFPVVVLVVLIVVLVAALVTLLVMLQRRRAGGAPGQRR